MIGAVSRIPVDVRISGAGLVFGKVPYPCESVTPDLGGIFLVFGRAAAVVHVDFGIAGRRQEGDLDPGHDVAVGAVEVLDFMVQFGRAVG